MDSTSKLLCEDCINRRDDVKSVILCDLTGMKPDYHEGCISYVSGHPMKMRRVKSQYKQAPPKKEIYSLKDVFEAVKAEFPEVNVSLDRDQINLSAGFFTTVRISLKRNEVKFDIPWPFIFPLSVVLVYLSRYLISGLIVSIFRLLLYLIIIVCIIIYYKNSLKLRNRVRSYLQTFNQE
jgi:hypothetical protein